MEDQEEIWKDITGYEGSYQISNKGNVKSLKREKNHWRGGKSIIKERILKPSIDGGGYLQVSLSKNSNKKTHKIHHLVAQEFLGKKPNHHWVLHKNDNKKDNSIENLYYGTPRQNQNDSMKNKKFNYSGRRKGENHYNSKLTKEDVITIRNLDNKLSQRKIAKMFNISHVQVSKIQSGESWSHI